MRFACRRYHYGNRHNDHGNCVYCREYFWLFLAVNLGTTCFASQGVNTAYNELNQSVNDLESVVDNWNSQPIVDMTSYNANSTNARCPTGFSELSGLRWPGANSLGWYVFSS